MQEIPIPLFSNKNKTQERLLNKLGDWLKIKPKSRILLWPTHTHTNISFLPREVMMQCGWGRVAQDYALRQRLRIGTGLGLTLKRETSQQRTQIVFNVQLSTVGVLQSFE